MKIGFLAYSLMVLERYWDKLYKKTDCWWGVTQPHMSDLLRRKGIKNIVYDYDKHIMDQNRKFGNKYVSLNPGRSERKIAGKINPDLWIADTLNKLSYVPKNTYWIQTFHTLPYKKHFFYPPVLEYDLCLLPGEYHKQELIRRLDLKEKDEDRLKVVGWPRVDDFFNDVFDRNKIIKRLDLNSETRTIMYAPTWGVGYGNDKLFARWFDNEIEVFEQLCREVKKMSLNFIVKLHPLSFHAGNKRLIDIAKKYDVLWLTKETSVSIDDPNPYLWITDILISDVSGIITDFMVLNRPIIYIDPDEKVDAWNEADMPKNFRVGHIVKTPEELFEAIDDSIKNPEKFSEARRELASKLFHSLDGKAIDRAVNEIMKFAGNKGLI